MPDEDQGISQQDEFMKALMMIMRQEQEMSPEKLKPNLKDLEPKGQRSDSKKVRAINGKDVKYVDVQSWLVQNCNEHANLIMEIL